MKEEIKNQENWARCPICNVVWHTSSVFGGSWYPRRPVKDCDLSPEKLPEKPCPDHVEEIVVDGRRKGIKRILQRDQLYGIKNNGMHCPVCKGKDLTSQDWYEGPSPERDELVNKCNQCHTLILVGIQFWSDDEEKYEKIAYVSYREDLETKELNEVLPDIARIIDSQGVKIESVG